MSPPLGVYLGEVIILHIIMYNLFKGPVSYGPGEAIGAPDHPHRGFEVVTYVLNGEMEHKDSVGNSGQFWDLRATYIAHRTISPIVELG